MATKPQFFRRALPETCVELASREGQRCFASAMATNGVGCFFHLISQFRTQDEPAYCGVSTLVMILNALQVDPGKIWKGVWRFWVEDMLDCCISLEDAKKSGITLDEFVCLAKCQGLDARVTRAPLEGEEDKDGVSDFRESVKAAAGGDGKVLLALSYHRGTLGQTGSGHFSPMGAYDAATDSILILDVARFKYPPHWVKLPLLYESFRKVDSSTGRARGWITISKQPEIPLLVCAPPLRGCTCIYDFMELANDCGEVSWENLESLFSMMVKGKSTACTTAEMLKLVQPRGYAIQPAPGPLSTVEENISRLLLALRQEPIYKLVCNFTGEWPSSLQTKDNAKLSIVSASERLTLLFMAVIPAQFTALVDEELRKEVSLLKEQLQAVHACSATEAKCCAPSTSSS